MSYAASSALQAAVYQSLTGDAALAALIGDAVYDEVPAGSAPPVYVMLGTETAMDRSDVTGTGSLHSLTITVVSEAAGFSQAKIVAGAVTEALAQPMSLSRGQLVYLNFERAVARRSGSAASVRQIDLRFRARVDDV
ncbi:DUF3168 domain-containing protein [Aestuariivita boseongensis]|uniref:DUF3168 domain-containing protein n=1 Tax=Aestuariivita boseongensis TaxID=1470562 RepID=UPI0006825DFC|nr:DUF3168 domain-containing protein [Aestuariivita boseongensis]